MTLLRRPTCSAVVPCRLRPLGRRAGVAEELLAAPAAFLASYRDGGNQGVGEGAADRSTTSATVIEDTSIRPEGDPDV